MMQHEEAAGLCQAEEPPVDISQDVEKTSTKASPVLLHSPLTDRSSPVSETVPSPEHPCTIDVNSSCNVASSGYEVTCNGKSVDRSHSPPQPTINQSFNYQPSRKLSLSPAPRKQTERAAVNHGVCSTLTTASTTTSKPCVPLVTSSSCAGGLGSQADPLFMELECRVLPFVQDPDKLELRLPAALFDKIQRRALKTIAAENELALFCIGKPPLQQVVIRKRASLQQRQLAEVEARKEAELQAKREAELQAERRKLILELLTPKPVQTKTHGISCQAAFDEHGREIGNRRMHRTIQANKRKLKASQSKAKDEENVRKRVDREQQTPPEDYFVCPWCEKDIPPTEVCGHEAVCKAGYKLQQQQQRQQALLAKRNAEVEVKRRQRLGLPVPKSLVAKTARTADSVRGASAKRVARSRSRTRERKDSKGLTNKARELIAAEQLKSVHPNDLDTMVHALKRLCSEPHCGQLAKSCSTAGVAGQGVVCVKCHKSFCSIHRPVGKHTVCAVDTSKSALDEILEDRHTKLKSLVRERRKLLEERRQRI